MAILPALPALPHLPAPAKVTAGAVLQLGTNTAVGACAVLSGLVEPDTIKALAKVIYSVLTPSFLFVSVIKTVSTYGFSPVLAMMPIAAVTQVCRWCRSCWYGDSGCCSAAA